MQRKKQIQIKLVMITDGTFYGLDVALEGRSEEDMGLHCAADRGRRSYLFKGCIANLSTILCLEIS